jgi:hypothetical protein
LTAFVGKRKALKKEANPTDDGLRGVLRPGAKLPPREYIYSAKRSSAVTPPAAELFIPPYVSHSGLVIPARYLYPISRDHLMPLIEYNLFRASTTNMLILGHVHLVAQKPCGFAASIPMFPNPYQCDRLPVSLRPTPLQQSAVYPDWMDLFPSPRMRDNAIRTQHLFTNDELLADLLGQLVGSQSDISSVLLVWSNPWEPSGWELTEGFIRKWWFLIQGCTDLFQSTNRWRALRGEEPLTSKLK